MKKIRIELLPNVKEKTYRFFHSVEALYEHECYGSLDESFTVKLEEGDFLEVEWMGCENLFEEDGTWHKFSYVRMCKASHTKNASGLRVAPLVGWIVEDDLRFVDSIDEKSTKTMLRQPEHSLLDFKSIFKDDEGSDENIIDDVKKDDEEF